MSEERLNDLVKFWDKQRPTMCTIDEDDIASIKCLLQKNQELQNINDKLSNALNSAEQKTSIAIDLLKAYIGVLDDTADLYFKNVISILQGKEVK